MWLESSFKFLAFIFKLLQTTNMSKTFLDADLDAEIEEMEKEEDNSEGEEENEGIDIEK